jgi:hypothetical protein
MILKENSLQRHRRGHILGMVRLAIAPLRRLRVVRATLTMTDGNGLLLPEKHIFLKPNGMPTAAHEYGFPFHHQSRPEWKTYANCLEFAETVRGDLEDLGPRDMIDLQSFIWVQGSSEYDE